MNPEVLLQMIESEDVRLRDRGVIAQAIYDNLGRTPEETAKAIVEAQAKAGLATFIMADIKTFIHDAIRAQNEGDWA